MTLIMPPGEEIISPKDGDADSGCFAESCEDGKDEGCNLKDGCLTPDLKRQQDVQDLSPPSPDLGPRHDSGGPGDDDPALFDPDDSDGSPGGTLDKSPPSGRSPTNPLVTYTCTVSVDSIPNIVTSGTIPPTEGSCSSPPPTSSSSPRVPGDGVGASTPRLGAPDCGGGDCGGATQETAAAAAAPVPLSPPSSPTHHSLEGAPVASKEGTTAPLYNRINFTPLERSRERLSNPDPVLRPRSFTVTAHTSDSASGPGSKVIHETLGSRSSCEIISSGSSIGTGTPFSDTRDSDRKSRHYIISDKRGKSEYISDSIVQQQSGSSVNVISDCAPPPAESENNVGLQAAKQKIITMRQNWLFSLATSETCDIQKPQVIKCVSVGSTKQQQREDDNVCDVNQVAAGDVLLKAGAQEGVLNEDDELREVVGVQQQQHTWQPHTGVTTGVTSTTPSSDCNRKSSLESWTRELQSRRWPPPPGPAPHPPPLTGVQHRENTARSAEVPPGGSSSRRTSQCSEDTTPGAVATNGQENVAASVRLGGSTCGGGSVTAAARPVSRGSSGNLSPRCDIPDPEEGPDQYQRWPRRDDPLSSSITDRLLTSSLTSHGEEEEEDVEEEEESRYCVIGQGRTLTNCKQANVSDAIDEHSQQLLSSAAAAAARDHERGGNSSSSRSNSSSSSSTCGGDITTQQQSVRLLPLTHQSVPPPPRPGHHEGGGGQQGKTTSDHCLHTAAPRTPPDVTSSHHNQELYQRPSPPRFSTPSRDTTEPPPSRSATTSPTGSPNTVPLLSPRDHLSKCGLVIALTGDPAGVEVRIVKNNNDGKLVKVQDERPKRYLESQIEKSSCVPRINEQRKSNEFIENNSKYRESIERPYIKDLDRGKLSSYENYFESDECNSDTSCVGLLNFDKNGESDSDVEYNEQRKRRLSEACKDIARAFDALPTPQEEEKSLNSPLKISKVPINFREKSPKKYKDQEIEACLSDDSEVQEQVKQKAKRVRSCGTSTASEDDKRNSFYDNYCTEDSSCDCGQCLTSEAEEDTVMSQAPQQSKSAKKCTKNKIISSRETSDCEEDGFRTDVGEGCRTDEFDPVSSDDDNDYDEDYCQTDDCGDDCDYCSGDDAEDEEEKEDMTCYYCRHAPSITAGCKHPGVITNGILRSYGSHQRSGEKYRVTRQRPLVLQAAIQRRRLSRRGLVAIRESSITSDENISEEESYDGSNCDISSSWKFGLHHDIPSASSRSSTLKSEKSSSSAPMERARITAKEKSNSLPIDMTRSLSGVEAMRQYADNNLLRHPSTSEEESGSVSSLGLRLPPRPPRAPKVRPLPSPSPPSSLISAYSPSSHMPPLTSPRPCMGLQGLHQRSPTTPKTLHASGLPVVPRTQVAPRSPSNPNPPYGFPLVNGNALLCPSSPSLPGRSTPSPVEVLNTGSTTTTEGGPPSSPRVNSRAGALVTRNFSISDDESSGRWTGGRRHVTITRHESVYKEVAEHGYVLPPGSPVDPYWLTWKLGVLQKTVEDVSGRLEEAEKTVSTWGPIHQDTNLADQHAHNVRKFREGLADLQRGVDDVNDQAARFSAHNVPLTPNNSAKLHDLNNRWKTLETAVNDRWRRVAGRSREVTPLTPAQLASSVAPPWERATTSNKVPYYINHEQESTHWDHPLMMEMLDELTEFNHIKFSAYRTATKLRVLQKKLALDHAKMQMATDLFDEHGLRGQNDRLIDVNDMVVVLSALYSNISADHPEINTTVAMDLCLNWLLNVYDSQRTGQMRVLSFKIGLVCLCRGHLEEKYRYMFRLIADPNRLVDQRKLGLLLHDCVQVPRQLGEVAAFGGSNIEPSVRSCFTKAGKDRETVEAVHFLSWVQQEPQSLVWLAVLHRVAASENIQHQVKCNICKTYPIIGLRYRCLKCLSFDMCQRCFFDGRSGKSHKVTHPMHEYCTATTAGEDVKDFTKALKNKFKSKRSLQKHTKKGYLPVQTVLEGDALESPSPSPQHNVSSQDMHSRLEAYASRLAEVELRTNSNSTPDSEDEHGLIAQYCQSLSSSDAPLPVPRSPIQIMAAVDADQKDELEQMIRDLEDENRVLQAEYDRLKSQQPIGSPPDDLSGQRSEGEMLAEAKLLRQHKGRLEARMGILEEHNRQLEAQLHRLRQLLGEPGGLSSPNKSGTLQTKSVTASQLAMDSPAKINGHSNQGGASSAYDGLEHMSEYVRPPPPPMGSVAHVGNLFSRAGDLGKAVGNLVATMNNQEQGSASPSAHEDDDDDDEDDDDSGREESRNSRNLYDNN